jgi:cupin fold WbuC family metalloprotein
MVKTPDFFEQRSDVVYSTQESVTSISELEIEFLRSVALSSSSGTARVLLHGNPDEELHEMLIVHSAGHYIRPHINDRSAKSFFVLDGAMVVVLFNDEGTINDHIHLGRFGSGSGFLLRLDDPVFHTVVPISDTVTFLETTKGPHLETHYASFSPSTRNTSEANKYMAFLIEELEIIV